MGGSFTANLVIFCSLRRLELPASLFTGSKLPQNLPDGHEESDNMILGNEVIRNLLLEKLLRLANKY